MSEEDKTALLNWVRQASLIAMALQQLLKHDSARTIIVTLNAEVSAHVHNELLRFGRQ